MSTEQLLGLITGTVFGFLLQKGRVLRFEKQVGAMLLQDMTIIKFMLSAMLIGMVGLHAMADAGMIALSHRPLNVGAIAVGAVVFGIGWAIMGYCPGTSLGAIGEGRLHAVFAVCGMVAGGSLYARAYPYLRDYLFGLKDFGRMAMPELLSVSHWTIIVIMWIVSLLLFLLFEHKKL